MAAMLYRYAQYAGVDTSGVNDSAFNSFKDSNTAGSWARESLIWATHVKLMNGNGNGTLTPTQKSTRAQVSQLLTNYCKYLDGQ